MNTPKRFWARVSRSDGCWMWNGPINNDGYGRSHWNKRHEFAHRISWIISFGEIHDGMCVCHHCDVPSCVRPDHLFLGTRADNQKDAGNKGRMPFGEHNPNAKLKEEHVLAAYAMVDEGSSYSAIARALDISWSQAFRIATGARWNRLWVANRGRRVRS